MVEDSRNDRDVVLPIDFWSAAEHRMQQESKKMEKRGKKGKRTDIMMKTFTFNLNERKFSNYDVQVVSNLFFEYEARTTSAKKVSEDFFVVHMVDDEWESESNPFNTDHRAKSYDVDPLRERILRRGILVEASRPLPEAGETNSTAPDLIMYNIIGSSNSMVQKHAFVFRRSRTIRENEEQLKQIIPELMQLEQKKGAAKRVKYAGLFFSGLKPVELPVDTETEEILSFKSNNFDFTDGPGLISLKLAHWVKNRLGLKGPCPSVFQIRYCGVVRRLNGTRKGHMCKGVLVVDPRNKDRYSIQVRESMLKVETSEKACRVLQSVVGICDYSRPSPGRLGQQQICLLSGTVPREEFLALHTHHLRCHEQAMVDPFSMAWVCALDRKRFIWECFRKLLISERSDKKEEWNGDEAPEMYRKCVKNLPQHRSPPGKKVQLPLAASRTLFGASFPEVLHKQLNEGECVVLLEDGPLYAETEDGANLVVVSRSPCYHPGDIRVLRVVKLSPGHPVRELRNCILFSTQGKRPEPDRMGGGDLDGDKYLVTWHPTLLKYADLLKGIQPADYDDSPCLSDDHASKEPDWIFYSAMTDNSMLGEAETTFYKLAKSYGVKSKQVAQLSTLFASLVDRHPTSLDSFGKLKASVVGKIGLKAVWEEMVDLNHDFQDRKEDTLKTYKIFRAALKDPRYNRDFHRKITVEFVHHFQEGLLRKQVKEIMPLIDNFTTLHTDTKDTGPDGDDEVDEHLENSIQLTKNEASSLSKLEDRARALFAGQLSEIRKYIAKQQGIVDSERRKVRAADQSHRSSIEVLRTRSDESRLTMHIEENRHRERIESERKLCELEIEQHTETIKKDISAVDGRIADLRAELNSVFGFITSVLFSSERTVQLKEEIQKRSLLVDKLEEITQNIKRRTEQKISSQISAHTGNLMEMQELLRKLDEDMDKLNIEFKKFAAASNQIIEDSLTTQQKHRETIRSMELGLEHILYHTDRAKSTWLCQVVDGISVRTNRKESFKRLMSRLERVYSLEENRLLGFPHGEKRNGSMPVYHKRGELQRHLSSARSIIITAGTGCGKSTQVPQYVADDFHTYSTAVRDRERPVRICCTQPRRVAAQKVASRVAAEYLTDLGKYVGFRVGSRGVSPTQARCVSEETIIEFVTEGLLLFNLSKSPNFISHYDCVIVDEMHERNTEQDLCLSLLRDYLEKSKESHPSFRVVVMSASIDAERFSAYFGNCPTMDCPGKNYQVQDIYAPLPTATLDDANQLVAHAVDVLFEKIVSRSHDFTEASGERIMSRSPDSTEALDGDVLIFLDGANAIDACVSTIQARANDEKAAVVAYPLYASLDPAKIDAATDPKHRCGLDGDSAASNSKRSTQPRRKVIVCTNIAETSLTIDGVAHVIESGRAKKLTYNHKLRTPVLLQNWVSHASTVQRRGRAGRTTNGFCYYLYSETFRQNEMDRYDNPNILQESVDRLILFSMSVCGKSIEEMGLLDPPRRYDISEAKLRLVELGLLQKNNFSGNYKLTKCGRVAGELCSSLRPESVCMLFNAFKKSPHCARKALSLAVILSSTESMFDNAIKVHKEDQTVHIFGDHLLALHQFQWFEAARSVSALKNTTALKRKCAERGLNFRVLRSLLEDVESCHRYLKKHKHFPSNTNSPAQGGVDDLCLLRSLVAGYFHHIVVCHDYEFASRVKCSHVTLPDQPLGLDRNSFLNRSLVSNVAEEFVDSETADCVNVRADMGDGTVNDLKICVGEVAPKFMIYGNLKSVSNSNMAYMLDASAIDGEFVYAETPARWLERTDFESAASTKSRVLISHIGGKVLDKLKGLTKVKVECGVDALYVNRENHLVVINGTQKATSEAQGVIANKIISVINGIQKGDFSTDGFINLGTGMVVRGQAQPKSDPFRVFRAFATRESQFLPGTNVVSFTTDKDRTRLIATPLRHFPIAALTRLLRTTINDAKIDRLKDKTPPALSLKWHGTDAVYRAQQSLKVLQQHNALLPVSVGLVTFQHECEENKRKVCKQLFREAECRTQQWESLRAVLQGKGAQPGDIVYMKSHKCFLIGAERNKNLSTSVKQTITGLAKNLTFVKVAVPGKVQRFQARRISAILAEIRRTSPKSIIFIASAKLLDNSVHDNPMTSSDYLWLLDLVKTRAVTSVEVGLSTLAGNEKASLQGIVQRRLSPKELDVEPVSDEEGCNGSLDRGKQKRCVMCRREVSLVCFHKNKTLGSCRGNTIEGWELSLCGCLYCRECFRHAVAETLEDETCRSARCLLCSRAILAGDCKNIINPSGKKSAVDQEEWNQLCRLAEANYCRRHANVITKDSRDGNLTNRPRGWATCPNCQCSMAHPAGYEFVLCRNTRCRSRMCTRCYKVPTTENDFRLCKAGKCEPRE